MPPTNLVFVFADQLRLCDLRRAGSGPVHTPNLQRLAGQGLWLDHHIANTPVCCPNRGTLLTGQFPTAHRILGNDLPLPLNLPSLGQAAKDAGCRTGYVGKWHLDGLPRSRFTPPGPRRRGFDDFWAVYNCSHAYFDARYYRDSDELIRDSRYEPVVQTDLAIEFLEQPQNQQQPFCLLLSWGPPHDPYHQVPAEHLARYNPQAIELRANYQGELPDNPLVGKMRPRTSIAGYYAAITALDEQLGRIMDKLDELKLTDNTLLIFTSDHGDMLWSQGWMKKQTPFEESIAVPLIARLPGVLPAGKVCSTLVGTVDLLPTICGLLSWSCPAGVQGLDLSAALRGKSGANQPQSALIGNHSVYDENQAQGMPVWRGVRSSRYTYVEQVGRKPWLLFNNEQDPDQLHNLVGTPAAAEIQRQLCGELTTWLERTSDPFLDHEGMMAHYGLTEIWKAREEIFRKGKQATLDAQAMPPLPTAAWRR